MFGCGVKKMEERQTDRETERQRERKKEREKLRGDRKLEIQIVLFSRIPVIYGCFYPYFFPDENQYTRH